MRGNSFQLKPRESERKNLISPPDADVPHVRAPVHPGAGLRRQMWGQDRLQASQVKVAAHQTASPQAARILPVQVLHATRTII